MFSVKFQHRSIRVRVGGPSTYASLLVLMLIFSTVGHADPTYCG